MFYNDTDRASSLELFQSPNRTGNDRVPIERKRTSVGRQAARDERHRATLQFSRQLAENCEWAHDATPQQLAALVTHRQRLKVCDSVERAWSRRGV